KTETGLRRRPARTVVAHADFVYEETEELRRIRVHPRGQGQQVTNLVRRRDHLLHGLDAGAIVRVFRRHHANQLGIDGKRSFARILYRRLPCEHRIGTVCQHAGVIAVLRVVRWTIELEVEHPPAYFRVSVMTIVMVLARRKARRNQLGSLQRRRGYGKRKSPASCRVDLRRSLAKIGHELISQMAFRGMSWRSGLRIKRVQKHQFRVIAIRRHAYRWVDGWRD